MKKLFIFAAIATAGLFASCSSSDDIAVNDQTPVQTTDDLQAIRLNLATPGMMATRGTGTVGGVGTGTNVWAGQSINVFMFTKTAATTNPDADPATQLVLTENADYDNTAAISADNQQYLYDNLEMITPGSADNKITNMGATANVSSGEAMIKTGNINYYPAAGNFDFFGYHIDGANTAAVDKTTAATTLWTVPFTIDGTQDLMSTKAELTADQIAEVGATYKDYYSAKAARKGVQPTLTFKHLLTRLQFSVKAGNDEAAGYTAAAPTVTEVSAGDYALLDDAAKAQCVIKDYTVAATVATNDWPTDAAVIAVAETYWEPDAPAAPTVYNKKAGVTTITKAVYDALPAALQDTKYFTIANYTRTQPATTGTLVEANAVKVKSIQVLSENTKGDLAVAWTAADMQDYQKITWKTGTDQAAEDDRWLTLKERPYKKNTTDAPNQTWLEAYKNKTDGEITALTGDEATAYQNALAALTAQINQGVYNTLSETGQAKYDAADNEQLVALTPTAPGIDGTKTTAADRYPAKRVGESIILSPGAYAAPAANATNGAGSATSLKMKVRVAQNVPTNWTDPDARSPKEQDLDLVINAPTGGFLQNTSYNIILTVYGLERIEVIAVITPWEQGADIPVGQD